MNVEESIPNTIDNNANPISINPSHSSRSLGSYSIEFGTLNIEDVDQHFNILEDIIFLGGEVRFHERFLATTIPKI